MPSRHADDAILRVKYYSPTADDRRPLFSARPIEYRPAGIFDVSMRHIIAQRDDFDVRRL